MDRCGFYPKGGGRCVLTARSLAPGSCLPPLDFTERGRLVGIVVTAFAAGRLGVGIAERMARAAKRTLLEVGHPGAQVGCSATGWCSTLQRVPWLGLICKA